MSQTDTGYVIELDLWDVAEPEVSVELRGCVVTVRSEPAGTAVDEWSPFRIREGFEESFRLPDDVDLDRVGIFFYKRGLC